MCRYLPSTCLGEVNRQVGYTKPAESAGDIGLRAWMPCVSFPHSHCLENNKILNMLKEESRMPGEKMT